MIRYRYWTFVMYACRIFLNNRNRGHIKEDIIMAKITQDAGREALGEFAPQFAHFNDDVLFGENWNNEDIDISSGRRNI